MFRVPSCKMEVGHTPHYPWAPTQTLGKTGNTKPPSMLSRLPPVWFVVLKTSLALMLRAV